MLLKKNQLFRVITALKPNEKAYFKKYAYKQDSSNKVSLQLFDIIDKYLKKSSQINEDDFVRSFLKKHPNHNYTKVKSYLLQLLLNTLREYDKKENEIEKINDYLFIADSLAKRNLFHDAKSILEKAVKLAEELEQVELTIFIKSKLYYYDVYQKKITAEIPFNYYINEINKDIDLLKNRVEEDFALYRIYHFQKTIGIPRSKKDFDILEKIKSHYTFDVNYTSQLTTSKVNLAIAKSAVFFSLNDAKSALQVGGTLIDNYHPNPKLHQKFLSRYLALFDSLLQAALLSFNLKVYNKYYPIFKQIKPKEKNVINLKLSFDLYARAVHAIISNQIHKYKKLIVDFQEIKNKPFIVNVRKVSLTYYMIFGLFLIEDYDLCYDEIQWLKNNKSLGIRYDVEVAIKTMESIILLEKNETKLLENQLRSFYEFLLQRERKFEMETALMKMLKNWLKAPNKKQLQSVFSNSLNQIVQIINQNPNENLFLNAFDIVSWLQSKITNQSFAKVYYINNIRDKIVV